MKQTVWVAVLAFLVAVPQVASAVPIISIVPSIGPAASSPDSAAYRSNAILALRGLPTAGDPEDPGAYQALTGVVTPDDLRNGVLYFGLGIIAGPGAKIKVSETYFDLSSTDVGVGSPIFNSANRFTTYNAVRVGANAGPDQRIGTADDVLYGPVGSPVAPTEGVDAIYWVGIGATLSQSTWELAKEKTPFDIEMTYSLQPGGVAQTCKVQVVPEPGTLIAMALGGVLFRRRRA